MLAGSGRNGTAAQEIAARFEGHFAALSRRSFLASEDWRTHRETVYDDMFARCTAAVSLLLLWKSSPHRLPRKRSLWTKVRSGAA
ncbi:MAG: hypothetical protein IPK89_13550 [Sphingomonadales bacterium]|nr:hypothetical protein [Sphingomonadales bacterium]